jgi:RNA polymerase sigma-70 factor, ECF subfamily
VRLRDDASAGSEGFAALVCPVIVTQRTEVDRVPGRELVEAGQPSARAAAFLDLAERHLDASYRLARAILHDRAEAEDATHDAFVMAWRRFATLRDAGRFEGWFNRILINTCRNRLARAARWRSVDQLPEWPTGGDAFGQADDRDVIGAALSKLSPDHRVVVALRFYRDLSVDQIARQLGVRPGTIHSRLHYALKQLAALIDVDDAKRTIR